MTTADTAINEKLGENLRRFRKQKGFTLHRLALATQAEKMTIMSIEKSELSPSNNLLTRLAKALDVSIEDLMG